MNSPLRNPLSPFLHAIANTRQVEFDCEKCALHVAELVENRTSKCHHLDLTRHHLRICRQCREDFQTLQLALENKRDL